MVIDGQVYHNTLSASEPHHPVRIGPLDKSSLKRLVQRDETNRRQYQAEQDAKADSEYSVLFLKDIRQALYYTDLIRRVLQVPPSIETNAISASAKHFGDPQTSAEKAIARSFIKWCKDNEFKGR